MKTMVLPVLPLRDIVVFPHMVVPLFVGREKSVRALEEVMREDRQILLASQRDAGKDDPETGDIFETGSVANVLQLLKLPDGTVKVLVEGKARARILSYTDRAEFFEATAETLEETVEDASAVAALVRSISGEFEKYVKLNKNIPQEAVATVAQIEDGAKMADTIAGHLSVKLSEKQKLLELTDVGARLERIYGLMQGEISVLQVEKKIKTRVKSQMERTQREYYLNEQMKAIQRELGEGEEGRDDASELEARIEATRLSKEAREKALGELKKLRQMSPMSAEATVVRNYLDWMLSIPWGRKSKVKKDLKLAEDVLAADHYGLEKVKERIVEYLAVQQRSQKLKGPILCLVGPPGVGKTSLGKSVAKATGREFIRISLGGVRDEAEIRGHRRTYIGSMPGKLVQSMKKAKTTNPLILLDEIDKMGQDFRGDPASAMLEVLDPEQNATFVDHYLEVEYDLSNVMFITTANTYNMPRPLLDRMEIISLSGYTEDEKREIARRHLQPKQEKAHGLKKGEFVIEDDALMTMIRRYTREAGVRNLERELAKLCRKALTRIVKGEEKQVVVTEARVEEFLGVPRFKYGLAEERDEVGVTTGLAWTEVGGDLLSIEALKLPGKGRMKTTGKLGDVMKESIEAAASFVRSQAPQYGVKPTLFEKLDIHVHVPEGATPKDGPSAGVAMVTSIVSVLTEIPVRRDVAMTGEVTLRGQVLPIGGLKEKLLAALRGGVKTVLIPKENAKDLPEIPDNVKEGLEIVPVATVAEVLKTALVSAPVPIEWDPDQIDQAVASPGDVDEGEVRAH
ncbi:endopeptidase La [Rubrimonas cliftonensis]|uniref:Lon protease n=1 Tax=Rubrimonas cliftonensis TaxID=89524 RepID=A0A1H4D9X3_9RHOB|nr:endopeptidase La [Rubrimonas cliftonensis]SEA69565.1 ATP-dependent proteinase. Serine peptidase. MEROPS family S16 [Rubrimonas cliftonensis]